MDQICAEMESRLLFDPTMVIRIPHLACYNGSEIRYICRCREGRIESLVGTASAKFPADAMPNITYVTLRWYEHTAGFIWVGKCENCGIIYFTSRTRR